MQGQKKHTDKLLISNAGPEKHNLPTQLINIYYYDIKKFHPWGRADLINDTHPKWGNLLRTFPLFSWCSDLGTPVNSILSSIPYVWGRMVYMGGDNFYWVDELGVDEPGTHQGYYDTIASIYLTFLLYSLPYTECSARMSTGNEKLRLLSTQRSC